ncbi:hybrid sensor histidine kinase/response regulator [Marinagarivorans algicola]|uniref:hybrid sensor histidine kinase/response regulator n=1 Tax=Marinagarivorans algicola TaxID=1513270 RepID=UPI003734ECD7
MGDKRNYAALEWVIGEIGEALNEARQALEAYADDTRDSTRIRFCLTHIHQVLGSLKMVEFHGASLFAEEMELLAHAIINKNVVNEAEALEVLMRSLLQLPIYLDHVKRIQDDHPGIVLPLLNDLRAARKERYLSETNLFTPELGALLELHGAKHPLLNNTQKLKEVLKKLFEMYQYAAASVLRGIKIDENLVYVSKVFARLQNSSTGTVHNNLWQMAGALVDSLIEDEIELSVAVKGLLRRLAKEIKKLYEDAPAAFDRPIDEALARNLLYYIARSGEVSRGIKNVKERYRLNSALFEGAVEGRGFHKNMISAPEPDTIRSVVTALREEMNTVKQILSHVVTEGGATSSLEASLPIVKRVADTLAVLGVANLRQATNAQHDRLLAASQHVDVNIDELTDVANELVTIEHRLDAIAKGAGKANLSDVNERDIEIDEAKVVVLQQSRIGLEKLKEAIVEFYSSQWDRSALAAVEGLIKDVRGGLGMIPLVRAAAIVDSCGQFIQQHFIASEENPSAETLTVLANAVEAVDYYLDRLIGDFSDDVDSFLELAEDALRDLGYSVSADQGVESSEQDAAEFGTDDLTVIGATPLTDEPSEPTVSSDQAHHMAPESIDTGLEVTTQQAPVSFELDESVDEDIAEIFVEEAREVLETLEESLPQWRNDTQSSDGVTITRRAFHTLKGSGRMVKAADISELAWSVENLINRIIDNNIEQQPIHLEFVERVFTLLPSMVDAFEQRLIPASRPQAKLYEAWATELANGQVPADFSKPENDAIAARHVTENIHTDATSPAAIEQTLEVSAADAASEAERVSQEDAVEERILWELFASEAQTHLAAIDEFIGDMDAAAPIYSTPTDSLQRALHTLKGSAHMAGVADIAQLAAPLELLIKELRTYQVVVDQDVLQLIKDAAEYTREGLEFVERNEQATLPKLGQFIARVAELKEVHLGHLIRATGAPNNKTAHPVDPRMLAIFMAEDIRLLLDADEVIERWEADLSHTEELPAMMAELKTLESGAAQANFPSMEMLSCQLHDLYVVALDYLTPDASVFEAFRQAHNTLLDMIDAVAAAQTLPTVDSHLQYQLDSFLVVPEPISDIAGLNEVDLTNIESFGEEISDADSFEGGASEHHDFEGKPEEPNADEKSIIEQRFVESHFIQERPEQSAFEGGASEGSFSEDRTSKDSPSDEKTLESSTLDNSTLEDSTLEQGVTEGTASEEHLLEESTADAQLPERLSAEDLVAQEQSSSEDPEEIIAASTLSDSISSDLIDTDALNITGATGYSEADDTLDLSFTGLSGEEGSEQEQVAGDSLSNSGFDLTDDVSLTEIEAEMPTADVAETQSVSEQETTDVEAVAATRENVEYPVDTPMHTHIEMDASDLFDSEEVDNFVVTPELLDDSQEEDSGVDVSRVADDLEVPAGLHEEPQHSSIVEAEDEPSRMADPDSEQQPINQQPIEQQPIGGLLFAGGDPSTIDAEDFDAEIIEIFLEEADELIELLEESIHSWESDWSSLEAPEEMKRALHTLKGGARLSNLAVFGDLTHEYETYLINEVGPDKATNFFSILHQYQDLALNGIKGVKARLAGEEVAPIVSPHIESANNSASSSDTALSTAPSNATVSDIPSDNTATLPTPNVDLDESTAEVVEAESKAVRSLADTQEAMLAAQQAAMLLASQKASKTDFVMPEPQAPAAQETQKAVTSNKKTTSQEAVKISSELLEELVNLAGETSISRGRIEQQVSDFGSAINEIDTTLRRLQEQLRRLDMETEAQIVFRQEQLGESQDFDPLEMDRYSQLQQLSRSLTESASDLVDLKRTLSDKVKDTETILLQQQRINSSLQEGLMRARMVPFSRMVPRLRRIVRQVAGELNKQVSFELDNVEGEMDRSVLEHMVAPLEHMLRNAVDHGIEQPAERLAAGKSESGRILLSFSREGGDILLRLADDGKGIALEKVRKKAIERGLMVADAELSDHEIMQFILQAGFSTVEHVTQISGRGVGMDVVAAEIKQLGGSMTIESKQDVGTQFTVRLPFTVSVNRALMVTLGKESYAIPLNTIEGIVRVSPFELEHYYSQNDARFEYAGESYEVRYLGGMLYDDMHPRLEGQVMPLPVILVRSAQHTMALQVDSLMGSREIVVKSLGAQFSSVQGMSGATVMGDGSVVVILDPHALVRRAVATIGLTSPKVAQPLEVERVTKTVMVVDDSVTVRKVTTRFLEREGFNVITAKDGVDALQVLQTRIPDVMLLDIEMPRMDGFEVAKNMRTTQEWMNIPIVMITSRTGDKHREHALSIGVNHYLGKPYQEKLLLQSINELVEA